MALVFYIEALFMIYFWVDSRLYLQPKFLGQSRHGHGGGLQGNKIFLKCRYPMKRQKEGTNDNDTTNRYYME